MNLSWSAAWRIARRDLSARFRGLRLLLVCLLLGVGALAAIGTLTGAIERELTARGARILGGDIEVSVWQRQLGASERAALDRLGIVSGGLRLQAMARAGDLAAPVELKAVDARWPLVGRLTLQDGRAVGAPPDGMIWLSQTAADRLALAPGGTLQIGSGRLTVGGIIADEPDRLGEGFTLGPVAIVAAGFPQAAGLVQPGAMVRTKYRALLRPGVTPAQAADRLKSAFPSAGFEIRTRDNASPGAERFVARMGEFLVLVGLAALVIAGIGIGGGVTSYMAARRGAVATLKVLGASGRDITRIYVLQVLAAALVGSAAGLAVGVAVTPLVGRALAGLLPVAPGFVLDPAALTRAALYGLFVALVFAAPPLLAARRFPALALMRANVTPLPRQARDAVLPVVIGVIGIAALALVGASQPRVVATFLAGAAGLIGSLAVLGWLVRSAAARLPRPRAPLLRIALANLHRPGAQTGALVTALGFGLSAFVLLASVQTSIDANIAAEVPARAPDYFVLDLPTEQEAAFRQLVAAKAPGARVRTVPALRGAILAYGPAGRQTRVADLKATPDDAWPLRGERGLTYADDVPQGNVVTAGRWWPRDYAGPPLVSIDERLADVLGLKLGDTLTIGLLGVERSATIASFRRIDWDSLGFNYVLVFSPNAIRDAPHALAATVDLPAGADTAAKKGVLLRAMVAALPASSVIEVGGILRQARALLDQVSVAVLGAASIAVLAGIAVLLGAIAAARASRLYDNVILRVLGAGRWQLLGLQLGEYGLLALVLAVVALGIGSGLGWVVVTQVFDFAWRPDWARVLGVLGAGVALVIGFALAASLPLLRARPAEALREL
ncbi:ABC transporter permease [Parablastomonas sp. CN1-191]|uniref:ABC transporter permease n=1 Tax=Parablastomonas sp. CN1-191 TaxID=3400908 RepID=UPI003BF8F52C